MKPLLTVLAASGVLMTAACAGDGAPNGQSASASTRQARVCFLPQTAVSFRTEADTTAYVRAGRNETFLLQTGGCRGLSAARSITLATQMGSARACVGETVSLVTAGPSLQGENYSSCAARIVAQLTPEQVEALPARLRP